MSGRRATTQEVARVLRDGGVVALTGAGISAESGIPTFRDPGGIWDRFDPAEFGTWEGVTELAMSHPERLADFLVQLRKVFGQARPGPGHVALARLEDLGVIEAVVTQNVDGLHQDAGSSRVIELHGSFSRTVCLVCGRRASVPRADFLAALDRAVLGLRTAFVPSLASLLPRCPECGGPARPDFVAFGEPVHDIAEAELLAAGARVLLVVGTSGEVFPAAAIPDVARAAGARIVEVAVGETDIRADLHLEGQAGSHLAGLVDAIRVLGPG